MPTHSTGSSPPGGIQDTANFVMDGNGKAIEWDSGAESIFGWTRAEALGRDVSELIIPERFRASHQAGLENFKAVGRGAFIGRPLEITLVDRNGVEFQVDVTISMEKTPQGYRFPTTARLTKGKKGK